MEGTIEERVVELVIDQLGVEKEDVTLEASFLEDLGADSLSTVELVMAFEEKFDIDIPDEDAEKIKTVGEAVKYIKKAIKKAKSDSCLADAEGCEERHPKAGRGL